MSNNKNLLTVSEAARRVGVSEGTLRAYDTKGVVHPVRDSAGRRLFSEQDIEIAKLHRAKSPW